MVDPTYNVLFLCTGNSARSIIAEAILNREGRGKFRAFSAGSHPKGTVNPYTIRLLRQLNYDSSAFRSKSWKEFAQPGAPQLASLGSVVASTIRQVTWPFAVGSSMGKHRPGCDRMESMNTVFDVPPGPVGAPVCAI